MKSEVSHRVFQKPLKFPCLMVGENGNVYLITKRTAGKRFKGTVVYEESNEYLGNYDDWADLEPFEGSVTLSND